MAGGTRVVIAAGGSGGHIFPAIALGRAIRREDASAEVLYVGSNKHLDRRIFEKEGARFELLTTNKLPYRLSPEIVVFAAKLLFDIARSFTIIVRRRPEAVVGFGGYVSFPVIAAAAALGIPTVVHEQNAVPGRANKALFALAQKIAVSFDRTRGLLGAQGAKACRTGNPIRSEIFIGDRTLGIRRFGLSPEKFTILVIGGSQGAHGLNKAFIDAMAMTDAAMKGGLQVIHITGVKDYEWALAEYARSAVDHRVHSFIDRIEEAYAAADLVVTRSGASALFELAYLAKPMVLVPYPFAMSHQAENAAIFAEAGAAVVLEEQRLSAPLFKETVTALVRDRQRLASLGSSARALSAPEAAGDLARMVIAAAERKR